MSGYMQCSAWEALPSESFYTIVTFEKIPEEPTFRSAREAIQLRTKR